MTWRVLRKRTMLPAIVAAAVLVPAGSASAHYCGIADKPASAGAIDEDKFRFNKGGNLVAPGAFVQVGDEKGDSIFVRGGEGHPTEKPFHPPVRAISTPSPTVRPTTAWWRSSIRTRWVPSEPSSS